MQILRTALLASVFLAPNVVLAQEVFDYNPPALGSSEAVKSRDLNLELDGINTDKVDFVDIDTSAELRAIITDEIDTGALVFLGTPADDQVPVGDSASDTTWRSVPDSDGATQKLQYDQATNTFSAGTDDDVPEIGDLGVIDTSAELQALLTDEVDTGVLVFLGTPADDQVAVGDSALDTTWRSIPDSDGATQKLQYDTTTNAFSAGTDDDIPDVVGDLAIIDTSAELRTLLTDEIDTGELVFLGVPADDQVSIGDSATDTTWRALPDSDGATQKLQYDITTNTFTAGTDDDIPEAGDFGALSATAPITQSGGTISTSMATDRLLGRDTAGTGVAEEIALAEDLEFTGTAGIRLADNAVQLAEMADDAVGIDELDLIDGDTPVNGDCLTYDTGTGGTIEAITCPGAAGGDSITVEDGDNGGTSTAAVDPLFEDSGDINFVLTGTEISALVRANSVAIPGDTTGNVVTSVADGTGIDGTCAAEDCTYTPTLDFNELTEDAVVVQADDFLAYWDTSEGAMNKVNPEKIGVGVKSIALLAGAGTLPSGGAIAACTSVAAFDSGTNDIFLKQCSFAAATDNAIYWTIPAPKSSDETVDWSLRIDWTSATGTDATDDVIWTASAVCFSNDDAINGTAFPAVDTATDTQTAAGDFLSAPNITAITPGGTWAENDACVLRVTRDADNASDNFNGTAELINAQLFITTNVNTDD